MSGAATSMNSASMDAPYDRQAARAEVASLLLDVGSDPAGALARAQTLRAWAAADEDVDVFLHARVIEADAQQRLGDIAEAAAIVTAVRDGHPDLSPELRVRTGYVLMRIWTNVGDTAAAFDHAVETSLWIDHDTPARLLIQFTIKYGDVLDAVGDIEAARERYDEAEQLAEGDPQLHLLAVNNLAFSELTQGRTERAVAAAARMVELSARYRQPLNSDELDTLAQIHLRQQRPDLAVVAAQQALDGLDLKGNKGGDDLPDILLTLATAQRHVGDLAAAADCLARARAIAGARGFNDLSARALEEEAELRAAEGDFRGAFEAHKAFHRADGELVSLRRESQTRARQAMYDSTQARAEAARFREEARRDPLTGLSNRLAVGEQLPSLLLAHRHGGMPVVAAVLDLDHFKLVNDLYSHEVGDEVLVTFADILRAAVSEAQVDGLAARLGGEEFLLVLAAPTVAEAISRVDDIRRAVEERDWSATTPGRSITVSAGVALADEDSTPSGLLHLADVEMYAAKAAGRNRLCIAETALARCGH